MSQKLEVASRFKRGDTIFTHYSKTCVKRPLSNIPHIGSQDQLSLNADQKYCRMLQGEHSAMLSTFITLKFVNKIFVLSIFEWPLKTGFTVLYTLLCCNIICFPTKYYFSKTSPCYSQYIA